MTTAKANHNLSDYKNLIDWAVRSHVSDEELPTLPQKKDNLLRQLNDKLGTKYERKHIDNWLSERSATPKRVRELLFDELLEAEVEFDFAQLGKELRRLAKP